MKRQFFKNSLGLSLLLIGSIVSAQLLPPGAKSVVTPAPAPTTQASSFVEGLDYRKLVSPQPTESKGKIEVVEFFWYGCPHCNDLEPELLAWSKRQKKDVVLKKVPVAFRDDFLAHSQIFYALESMGKEAEFTPKVFQAIHTERKSLLKEEEISNWVAAQGLDQKAFMTAYKSFTVITKAKTANTVSQSYRVDGVPTIAVQGKYMTSPSIAGTKQRAIETLDFLVEQSRSGKM
ncbi:thiol:disulfide interchange protein DsbA/DsbL [Polynucleobacter kasalickyi]|uniref:Thiol:disulfide interchange protein DsbA n=1 Tax=Polynucleobacter kasalickyi TaxID=1938817 RepID=A0A1W2AU54_9BURK|nr:thiol:disulfide interchange protein DsbA/DsbL [Polynucleobacter kasalickyi]SMC63971.1 Thiol:disulfide interchange protein DsbA [Polynucleobacter kasalickyi]